MSETVSVVVPTLDNPVLLAECVASLRKLDYPADKVEIVVADNGSKERTAEMLRSRYPKVRHIKLGSNTGFVGACNRGASEASGEYVAFINDDAVAEPGWLEGLFAGLEAGGEGTVCAAAHIRSQDGREVEFSGASANLFGVGRPRSVWGWPGSLETPGLGTPLLFASGGAMLIQRRTFLDVGGFDPHFFAYFEDVDLGWRLWALGYKVAYAPGAVVRHIGGATGSRAGAHRRYVLWESNSLATVLKNYESGNMERILSAALLLLYKRALLSAGEAFDPAEYRLGGRPDTNTANVEALPRISVAHLAAIDRFNSLLPRFMEERRTIQARRVRSDAEIVPLLGRAFEPQFAGSEYARAAGQLASAMGLYGITAEAAPNRVLVLASMGEEEAAREVAARLKEHALVALALLSDGPAAEQRDEGGVAVHYLNRSDPALRGLVEQADGLVALPGVLGHPALAGTASPIAVVGEARGAGMTEHTLTFSAADEEGLLAFCREPYFV
ncbi:MAG: glycosyltransferase family 2 protein [Chloroflexia bacterium]